MKTRKALLALANAILCGDALTDKQLSVIVSLEQNDDNLGLNDSLKAIVEVAKDADAWDVSVSTKLAIFNLAN